MFSCRATRLPLVKLLADWTRRLAPRGHLEILVSRSEPRGWKLQHGSERVTPNGGQSSSSVRITDSFGHLLDPYSIALVEVLLERFCASICK